MAGQVRRDERVNSAAARPDRAPDIRLVALLSASKPRWLHVAILAAGKLVGFFVGPPECVLPHVNSLGRDVVLPSRGTFRRANSSKLGHENSFQRGLRNSAHIRARQHRCCECPARDCSAGFNEQLI